MEKKAASAVDIPVQNSEYKKGWLEKILDEFHMFILGIVFLALSVFAFKTYLYFKHQSAPANLLFEDIQNENIIPAGNSEGLNLQDENSIEIPNFRIPAN